MGRHEEGSVLPLVAAAMMLAGLLALGLGRVGQATVSRASARTAADAAALAGASEGRRAAEELARANGARMTAFERLGADVRVTVRVGGAEASARATAEQGQPDPASPRRRPVRLPG